MTTSSSPDASTPDAAANPTARASKRQVATVAGTPTELPRTSSSAPSKADQVIRKLGSAKGVTIQQIMEATGWQSHSVRGFLSAVVRNKLGKTLVSEISKDGLRRYRIAAAATVQE